MINYVEKPSIETWKGIALAIIFCVSTIIISMLRQHELFTYSTLEIRTRAALLPFIYRKVLTMAPSAQQGSSPAEIVDLMTVDVQRVFDCLSKCWIVWSAPIQVLFASMLLYFELGPVALLGLALLIALPLFNIYTTPRMQQLSVTQLSFLFP